LDRDFFSLRIHTPPLGPQASGYHNQFQAYSEKEKVERIGADTLIVKKKHESNPLIQKRKEDRKTSTLEAAVLVSASGGSA